MKLRQLLEAIEGVDPETEVVVGDRPDYYSFRMIKSAKLETVGKALDYFPSGGTEEDTRMGLDKVEVIVVRLVKS